MTTHQAQVPAAVARYFGWEAPHPVIEQTFRPGIGWKRYPFRKRISVTWARRHLRPEGVTHVALRSGARLADFRIEEVVR